jgi:hypothetical protein
MGERVIKDKFNIHETYRKMNITNPYRFGAAPPQSSYLLDDYTGAYSAYSFRKLSSTYTGACIRLRRGGDFAEQDIGFSGDYIDTAAITSFIGSNDGFIAKFYDQSGNFNDWVAMLSGNQAPYVALGGAINYYDGKVIMKASVSTNKLTLYPFNVTDMTDFQVIEDSGTGLSSIGNGDSNSRYYGVLHNDSTSQALSSSVGNAVFYVNNSLFTGTTRGEYTAAIRVGSPVIATTFGGLDTWLENRSAYNSGSLRPVDSFFEKIIYPSDRADRADINTAINSYYQLY